MKHFTADELRIIVAWANAFAHDEETTIGHDTLSPREVIRLKEKLDHADYSYSLGLLNAAFMLGFDRLTNRYPMKALIDSCSLSETTAPSDETVKARMKLALFLQEAGLIP